MTADIRRFEWKSQSNYREKMNWFCTWIIKQANKVYPQRADFTFYGGIYRDVTILTVSRSHFDLDYFGGPGIRLTPKVEETDGVLIAEAYVTGACDSVRWSVLDHTGVAVAHGEGTTCRMEIPEVHLWDGTLDPYLYTVCAELFCDGKVTDCVEQKIGFRSYRFDPKQGFFLNGRSYPLHGVSRHQDWKELGNAITKEHHDKDMELIREVGANSIRLAHYQHDQYFYDLCDQYGMVVWAEIPYISEHLVNGRDNTVSQMKELIIQNYHHASIVTWGISNEITIKDKNRADMLDNHHMLNDLVHELDPSRPTTLACYAMCMPTHKVVHITDLVGYNLYLGWYVPFPWLNDLFLKGFHKICRNVRCVILNTGQKGCRISIPSTQNAEIIQRNIRQCIMSICWNVSKDIRLCGELMCGICLISRQMPEIRAESRA